MALGAASGRGPTRPHPLIEAGAPGRHPDGCCSREAASGVNGRRSYEEVRGSKSVETWLAGGSADTALLRRKVSRGNHGPFRGHPHHLRLPPQVSLRQTGWEGVLRGGPRPHRAEIARAPMWRASKRLAIFTADPMLQKLAAVSTSSSSTSAGSFRSNCHRVESTIRSSQARSTTKTL